MYKYSFQTIADNTAISTTKQVNKSLNHVLHNKNV